MTLYLLDANVLIRAHEDYYPVDRIPQFWIWLLQQAESGVIRMPRQIFDEVTPPPGPLADWLKRPGVKLRRAGHCRAYQSQYRCRTPGGTGYYATQRPVDWPSGKYR